MITVKLGTDKTEEKGDEYPCLKINHESERIVLFTALGTGYQIACNTDSACDLMYFSDDWDESVYELYPGTVTLINA